MSRVAVLVPCLKRPEYTAMCMESLKKAGTKGIHFYLVDDGSNDGTDKVLMDSGIAHIVTVHKEPIGLRNTIIEFFDMVKHGNYEYLAKMDNDCLVPENWVSRLIENLEKSNIDIISPNVAPSNAAFVHGKDGFPVRPSEIVGGLWCMKASLPKGIDYERFSPNGISGAFNILKQIIFEKEARVGWDVSVLVQDIGHWSGNHPLHIKSDEHQAYSVLVGRPVSWA